MPMDVVFHGFASKLTWAVRRCCIIFATRGELLRPLHRPNTEASYAGSANCASNNTHLLNADFGCWCYHGDENRTCSVADT